MQWAQISETGRFGCIVELEPVFGALGLLTGDKAQDVCVQIYGQEQVDAWKGNYRFLFEAFQAVKGRNPWGMLDFLLDVPLAPAEDAASSQNTTSADHTLDSLHVDDLTLEDYRDYVLALPEEELLWALLEPRHLEQPPVEIKALLRRALTEDDALDQVYEWMAEDCPSFLGFTGFVRQNRRFVRDFFALATELQNDVLAQVLAGQEESLALLQKDVAAGVTQVGDLAFSELQLGKSFRNRGPYKEFLFLASYLMPAQACRFFHMDGTDEQRQHQRQILFLSLRQSRRRKEDTLKSLKAAADGTRYQILMLLAKKGPLRGLDIAKEVSIATSTVSHHMDQLKEGGWITEEPVKNSKYYELNRKNAAEFLQALQEDLELS